MIATADPENRVRSGVPLLSDPVVRGAHRKPRLLADILDARIPRANAPPAPPPC